MYILAVSYEIFIHLIQKNMGRILFSLLLFAAHIGEMRAADLFVETESFSHKGGWVVDQQFMDLMGRTCWPMAWEPP